jgi:hypothetical protein
MASFSPLKLLKHRIFLGKHIVWRLQFKTDFGSTEKAMEPSSETTALEGEGEFQEYAAANKLKGKKALITGGE